MHESISLAVKECVLAVEHLKKASSIDFIAASSDMLANCYTNGNKVIIAGNGGSLCDSAHFAEELTGQFRAKRKALSAIALTDPGHITCVGNDFGFEYIFSRGVEAYGKSEDIFIGLTTSGNSLNLVNAFTVAKSNGLKTIAFLGKKGGKLKGFADLELVIDMPSSDRIQEAHMAAIHVLIEMVEKKLFYLNNSPYFQQTASFEQKGVT